MLYVIILSVVKLIVVAQGSL